MMATVGNAGLIWNTPPVNTVKSVLVTGSAGRVGQAVVLELLKRGHIVQGFDRDPSPNLEQAWVADLENTAALAEAMEDVEALVHLAATPDDVEDPVRNLFPPNITGLFNVMEAARIAGVRRVILASSGQVNWYRVEEGPWPLDESTPVSPKSWYAATKMFMEAVGCSHAEKHGMSVIVARLGWCPRDEGQVEEIAAESIYRDVYLSPGDAGRFFAGCLEADADLKYVVLYATSRPVDTVRYDLARAREIAGFEPEEQWPDGTEIILGRRWEAT